MIWNIWERIHDAQVLTNREKSFCVTDSVYD
jgi:hypothetical protein